MFHNNSTSNDIENDIFPFTELQIKKFKAELDDAGSFESLMIKKHALKNDKTSTYVATVNNIEKYKRTFLTGGYRSLQPFYDTEMPYIFWTELYEIVQKRYGYSEKQF